MKVNIILNQPYPQGMASTHRVHLYSKGILNQGHQVKIYLPVPHSYNKKLGNLNTKGTAEGVDYEYTSLTSVRSNHFLFRRIHDLLGLFNAGRKILERRNESDAIILVSTVTFHILFFKVIALLSGNVFLTECNEHPFAFARKGSLRSKKWFQKFYVEKIITLYDGLLVISNNLLDYYKNKIGNKVKYQLIPVLVDIEEFSSLPSEKENYVAYAGNLSEDKDGLYTQIQSFAKACKVFPDLKFYVIGNSQRPSTKEKAQEIVEKLGIENNVFFTGFVSRQELVKYFKNASALMLFKPKGIQADYCFPSKIAEYLASGTPVITTKTGELINLLRHRESALLSSPDEMDQFANNLIEVLSDIKLSNYISKNGFEIARANFDYQNQSLEILKFIKELRGFNNINKPSHPSTTA